MHYSKGIEGLLLVTAVAASFVAAAALTKVVLFAVLKFAGLDRSRPAQE